MWPMCIRRIIFSTLPPGWCPAIIDGTRFQCRAGGPTTSASVGDLERGAPCPLYHPLFPPCLRRFSPLVSHCPKRPCPIHRVGPYHALLPLTTSRWHCVCTGFRRDTNYHTRHVSDAVHPPSHPLSFTWLRACPTPPAAHLHPGPASPHTGGCNASFPRRICPQTRVHHTYSPRHHSSHPPFARTRLALRPRFSTRFSTLTLTLLSVDRRVLLSFSVAVATVPALCIYILPRCACLLYQSLSLPPSVGPPCPSHTIHTQQQSSTQLVDVVARQIVTLV